MSGFEVAGLLLAIPGLIALCQQIADAIKHVRRISNFLAAFADWTN
jgi:hypothetical protein